jgi:hypothetical protein
METHENGMEMELHGMSWKGMKISLKWHGMERHGHGMA